MNGLYVTYYTGHDGYGQALFELKDGKIRGADVGGGLLDGTYKDDRNGGFDVSVKLSFTPGTVLVTGALVTEENSLQVIETKLPKDFATGKPVRVDIPTGPLNMSIRKLRNSE